MTRSLIAAFLLLTLAHMTFAQVQRTIDSLTHVLATAGQDSNRVNILNTLAIYSGKIDDARTKAYAEEALSLARSINYRVGISDAYNNLGNLAFDQADYRAAEDYHRQALALREEIGHRIGIAGSLNNIGLDLYSQTRYEESIPYFEKALSINEEMNNLRWQLINHRNLASLFVDMGRYPEVLKHRLKSRELALKLGDKKSAAKQLRLLGDDYLRMDNYPEAMKYYYSCLKESEGSGFTSEIIGSYLGLGTINKEFGNFSEAKDNWLNAIKLSDETADVLGSAVACNRLGLLFSKLGDNPQAMSYYQKALKGYEQLNDLHNIATTEMNIGLLYIKSGNYAECIRLCKKTLKTYQLTADKLNTALVSMNLGEVYLRIGNTDSADYYSKAALSLASEIGDLGIIYGSNETLSKVDSALGNYRQAFSRYKQCILLRDSIKSEKNRKKVIQQQMQYEFEKKERDLKCRMDLSEAEAREAQERYRQQLLLTKNRQQELELKEAALLLSNREKEMSHLAFLRKQADLEVSELQKLDKQKALSISLQENALQEMKLNNRSLQRNILGLAVALSLVSIFLIFKNYSNQRHANRKLKALNAEVGDMNLQLKLSNEELNHTLEDLKQTQTQLVATEKAKETEVIRRRISQDIHDDISSGLTRIAWLSETARELAESGDKGDVNSTLGKIMASSRDTIERLGEIVWAINPDKDNLEGFFAYLRTYIANYLEGRAVKVSLDFPEEKINLQFNPDLKRTLFLVIKEAIHNVVKHAEATSLEVSFRCPDHHYDIRIADNGRGFDPAHLQGRGNGLANMKQRMQSVGGELEIVSTKETGTKIMLKGNIYN